LFGIGKQQATVFATLLFFLVTVPLWAGGFVALLAAGLRLRELRSEAQNHLAEAETNR